MHGARVSVQRRKCKRDVEVRFGVFPAEYTMDRRPAVKSLIEPYAQTTLIGMTEHYLVEPLRPARTLWFKLLIALIVTLAGLAVLHWHRTMPVSISYRHMDVPFLAWVDSAAYLAIAEGNISEVASPFPKRLLYPLLAGGVARATRLELPDAFLLLNMISLAVFAYCVASFLARLTGSPWLALPLLLTPFPMESLELAYIPDLFLTALTAVFFLLLLNGRYRWGLVVLFIAFLARESTMLLCASCAAVAFSRRNKMLLYGSLGVLILGLFFSALFAKMGLPNIHLMPDILYMACKVPYNFLSNVLGIFIWSDIRNEVGIPFITWQLPAFLHVADQEIGICLDWRLPVNTLVVFLTIFGSGPLFAGKFLRHWRQLPRLPLAVQLALVYGLISFVLGTSLGNWTERLLGYGWPAFWIGVVYLCHRTYRLRKSELAFLVSCYLLICWLPPLLGYTRQSNHIFCLTVLVPYLGTFIWLKKAPPRFPEKQAPEECRGEFRLSGKCACFSVPPR